MKATAVYKGKHKIASMKSLYYNERMQITVEEKIAALLSAQNKSLATAESCTGGLIASRITRLAGASVYFRGGVVAYANEIKEKLLGVKHTSLLAHGAVSHEIAAEMALGVCKNLSTDYGISVTGIAGPGGGTSQKPVGLVYIGLNSAKGVTTRECHFAGSRVEIQAQAADKALHLLLEALEAEDQ